MLNSKLDVEFAMAYEVILDDLKSGLKNDNTTQVPCSTASSSAAGKQKLSLPEEDNVFLETIPMENNLETKGKRSAILHFTVKEKLFSTCTVSDSKASVSLR